MKQATLLVALLLLIILIAGISSPVAANRVTIPPYGIPNQEAIVGWDGSTEVLILSSDVLPINPLSNQAVVILPLPSIPDQVEAVDKEVFQRMRDLLDQLGFEWFSLRVPVLGGGPGGSVLQFERIIGPHHVCVYEVIDAYSFADWLRQYISDVLKIDALQAIPEKFESVVSNYVERGYRYFVIDDISIQSGTTETIEPIAYVFQTDRFYYPLLITSLSNAWTTGVIYVVTPEEPRITSTPSMVRASPLIKAKRSDLIAVHPLLKSVIPSYSDAYILVLAFSGHASRLTSDLEGCLYVGVSRAQPYPMGPILLATTALTFLILLISVTSHRRRYAHRASLPSGIYS